MGLLSSIGNALFGDGGKAADRAGDAQVRATQLGVDELRRQFDETRASILPFIQAGTEAIPFVNQGSTVHGLNQRLAGIMNSDYFDSLVDEREKAIQNQLASSGLRRSGAGVMTAADVPTDLALAIEEMMHGRQANLMGSGQNAAVGVGALGSQASGGIANLFNRMGQARGNAILQGQQADAQSATNLINTGLTAASIFFSDERLKENMEPIGKINGLTLYQWEWKPSVKEIAGTDMDIGFSAQEVESWFPQYVLDINGLKAINYPGLIEELQW